MKIMTVGIRCAAIVCLACTFACDGGDDTTGSVDAAAEQLADSVNDAVETVTDDAAGIVPETIDEIKAALAEKEGELEAIKEKLAGMSPSDLTGSEAGSLKEKSEALMEEIANFKQKLADAVSD